MERLTFFYRQKNPFFFSIEKVFENIAGRIAERYAAEFEVREVKVPFPNKPRYILKNMRFARKHQAGVNHVTGDIHYVLPAFQKKGVNILTIHDCVPLHQYPRTGIRHWIIQWLWYRWPVRVSDVVTVISENTKRELVSLTNADPGKIRVIPNFVDPHFLPAPGIFNESRPRILFIGTTPNKNLERLITALAGIPVVLDIIGDLSGSQLESLRAGNITYERSAGLTREEVLRKYNDCDLLAFPSTYEGFGLPIVEAQAIGRPVLTSDLSPMNEVAGTGACLVNPFDTESIRQGILRIIGGRAYREELVRKGGQNIKRFSLDTVTDQYVSLYKEFITKKLHS